VQSSPPAPVPSKLFDEFQQKWMKGRPLGDQVLWGTPDIASLGNFVDVYDANYGPFPSAGVDMQ